MRQESYNGTNVTKSLLQQCSTSKVNLRAERLKCLRLFQGYTVIETHALFLLRCTITNKG